MLSQHSSQKQRINMTHGFMKSVIRNQIDRDNYDKEVKAKQQGKSSCRPCSKKPKKPEMKTYIPPQRLRKDDQEIIFTLEYEHKDGEIFRIDLYKYDCPKNIAKKVGFKFGLSEEYIEALSHLLQAETDARSIGII